MIHFQNLQSRDTYKRGLDYIDIPSGTAEQDDHRLDISAARTGVR